MRITLLTTYPHGGAGIACRRLQAALNASGVQADLLTQQDVPGRWPFYAERLSFLPYERDKSVRFLFSLANFGHNLSKHPLVQQADVLHLHWVNQGFLSLQNLRQLAETGKPIVWTLHDQWAFTGGCHYAGACTHYRHQCGHCPFLRRPGAADLSHRIWLRKKRLLPPQLQIVTCSEWLAERARESSLLRDHSVVALPNPINTAVFVPLKPTERLAFRQRLGISERAVLVLFAAVKVQDTRKGFHLLGQALEHLKKTRPDVPVELLVMGQSQPEALAALPYPVHALGMIRETAALAEVYGAADLHVIPSLEENLPNTVMESLACGTPVVGFRVGGIPEMVDHGENGFIVEQQTGRALADGLVWVGERADALRASARAKVERCYAENVVAQQHVALYGHITSARF